MPKGIGASVVGTALEWGCELRDGFGGAGKDRGGDGVVRAVRVLERPICRP